MPFSVTIIAPERTVLDVKDAAYLLLSGVEGELGVEEDHTPMLVELTYGKAVVRYGPAGDETQAFSISRGFAQIGPEQIQVLADAAEKVEEIDVERARAARDRAQERLRTRDAQIDVVRAEAALQRALGRLRVVAGLSESSE